MKRFALAAPPPYGYSICFQRKVSKVVGNVPSIVFLVLGSAYYKIFPINWKFSNLKSSCPVTILSPMGTEFTYLYLLYTDTW